MDRNLQSQMGETIISTKKIWANIKAFWWICLITLVLAAGVVAVSTYRGYQANQVVETKDSYVGSAVLYLSSTNDKDARAYAAILRSQATIQAVNNALEAAGMDPYTAGKDSFAIQSQSDSTAFGLTILSIGQERTQVLLDEVIRQVLMTASEVMGVKAELLSEGVVKPCIWYADGSFKTIANVDQRKVTLSLADFITWKKLMIVCAGAFMGVAAIFVAILFDNKVRSSEELQAVLDVPYFGELGSRKKDVQDKTWFMLQTHFLAGESKIMLTTAGKEDRLKALGVEMAEKLQASVMTGDQAMTSVDTMRTCAECDSVILAVRVDRDNMNQIRVLVQQMQVAQIHLAGYVLI